MSGTLQQLYRRPADRFLHAQLAALHAPREIDLPFTRQCRRDLRAG
jgi:hypothetical protein